MDHYPYVIQAWSTSTVVWCDFLSAGNRPYAENLLEALRKGETRLTGPHRRQYRLIERDEAVPSREG